MVANEEGNTIVPAKVIGLADLRGGRGQGLPLLGTLSMFMSPAYAQGAGASSDFLVQLVPILLMFVIFYVLLLRPQQQRAKAHKELVANIRRGDTVVTAGGIVGKVTKVRDDNEIEVEIADNTRVRVVKGTVSEVRAKGEPVKESA